MTLGLSQHHYCYSSVCLVCTCVQLHNTNQVILTPPLYSEMHSQL